MARIRSIKPEFWTSAQVISCSPTARLLFIGLWNFCDDEGRHPFSPRQIKAEVLPADDVSADDVLGMIKELSENGLLQAYDVEGKQYLQVTGWKHQKIDKPQKAKYPAMNGSVVDLSENVPRLVSTDRIGEDRKGEDRNSLSPAAASVQEPASPLLVESPLAAAEGRSKYNQIADVLFALLPDRTDWKIRLDDDISPIIQAIDSGLNLHDDVVPLLRERINKLAAGNTAKPGRWSYFRTSLEERVAAKKAAENLDQSKLNGHAVEPAKVAAGPDWDRLVRDFKEGGRWLLGHDPNSPACDAPLAIRQKYGYGLPRVYDPWVVFSVNAGKIWVAAGLDRPTDVDVVKEWRDLGYDAKISLAVIEVAVKAGARTLTECSNAVIRANETIAEGAA